MSIESQPFLGSQPDGTTRSKRKAGPPIKLSYHPDQGKEAYEEPLKIGGKADEWPLLPSSRTRRCPKDFFQKASKKRKNIKEDHDTEAPHLSPEAKNIPGSASLEQVPAIAKIREFPDDCLHRDKKRRTNTKENLDPDLLIPTPLSPDAKSLAEKATANAARLGFSSPAGRSFALLSLLHKHGKYADESFHEEGASAPVSSMFQHGAFAASIPTPRRKEEDKKVHIETSAFVIDNICSIAVLSKHHFTSGLKNALVLGITNYIKIGEQFKDLVAASLLDGRNIEDKDIALTIRQIVHKEDLSLRHKFTSKDIKLIGKVTYLLFAIESNRDHASIITNGMFIDLVENGMLTMADIASLPMSIPKAKGIHRGISEVFEREGSKPLPRDPKMTSAHTREILDRYCDIVRKWVDLKFPGQGVDLVSDIELISDAITEAMENWYNIKAKPVLFSRSSSASLSEISDDESVSDGSDDSVFVVHRLDLDSDGGYKVDDVDYLGDS